ncbi:MAG: vanadium-dependent haloperoxidase [Saprospiraceae bacterium]|nr:vanadium-dependent haloperoxidase [Saprospiraceae bacterium]
MRIALLLSLFLLAIWSCNQEPDGAYKEKAADAERIHQSIRDITDVIVHDIFSPPVASRIYAYTSIAAYEALAPGYPDYQSLGGQLNDLEPVPQPEAGKSYCYPLASVVATLAVGKALIFSEEKIDEKYEKRLAEFKKLGVPREEFDRSVAYGEVVAKHILDWAGKDNYKQTRTFPKYTITGQEDKWEPTPPDYMDALEPHWNKIRTFAIDSAQQFRQAPPTPYSTDKNSQFMKETMEVYNAFRTDTAERTAIAKFWDCNPYVSHHAGHVMFATKKITPGGHWLNIVAIACRKADADIMTSAGAYALTAIAIADGFIGCWDEKYRSQTVRPETVINKFIDEEWRPLLQTPPFPEYISGHSTVSRAAATVMTSIFGDNFSFTDDTEEPFGMPARSFTSFYQASDEASISRMYGGIHYTPGLNNGIKLGGEVGQWVLDNVKTKK